MEDGPVDGVVACGVQVVLELDRKLGHIKHAGVYIGAYRLLVDELVKLHVEL